MFMISTDHIKNQEADSKSNLTPQIYEVRSYNGTTILENLVYAIIRPPRFMYNQKLLHLPPQEYQTNFTYHQYSIPFKLSLYKAKEMKYVILYLHGNASSRYEGFLHLQALPTGVGLACFDFNGCGMRLEADFITLGKKESQEVDIAAKFLRSLGYIVVGWGRSMGAVSLLLSEQCEIMVADSPFSSLTEVCKSTSKKMVPSALCCLYYCLFPCIFKAVCSKVQQKSGLQVKQLEVFELVKNAKNLKRRLFIMAGKQDQIIPYEHARKIYSSFPGQKKIKLFDGTHDSSRPQSVTKECFYYIEKWLGLTQQKKFQEAEEQQSQKKVYKEEVLYSQFSQKKLNSENDDEINQINYCYSRTPRNLSQNEDRKSFDGDLELSINFSKKLNMKSQSSDSSPTEKSPQKLLKRNSLNEEISKNFQSNLRISGPERESLSSSNKQSNSRSSQLEAKELDRRTNDGQHQKCEPSISKGCVE